MFDSPSAVFAIVVVLVDRAVTFSAHVPPGGSSAFQFRLDRILLFQRAVIRSGISITDIVIPIVTVLFPLVVIPKGFAPTEIIIKWTNITRFWHR